MMMFKTNSDILIEIGKRLKQQRISLRLTQKETASEANVSLKTLVYFEQGHNVSMLNFISILRALKSVDQLNLILPEQLINPLDYLKKKKLIKRVRSNRNIDDLPWKWADES